jgi:hypothetical protein
MFLGVRILRDSALGVFSLLCQSADAFFGSPRRSDQGF